MAADKDLQKDLEAIRADIAALTDTVGRLAKDMAEARATMRERVKSAAGDAAAAGGDLFTDAMKLGGDAAGAAGDAAHEGLASLESEIRRKPISAVLAALGIGFIVGIIGRR